MLRKSLKVGDVWVYSLVIFGFRTRGVTLDVAGGFVRFFFFFVFVSETDGRRGEFTFFYLTKAYI